MTHAAELGKSRKLVAGARWGTPGYTLPELIVALLVGMILTALAAPQISSALNSYRLQGAIASATWAIQSIRYQALVAGRPYQVVFTKSTNTYQIQSSADGGVTFTNAGSNGAVPLSGSATVLNQDTTLRFKPNGFVSAPVGALNFTITYKGLSQQACVSNYANIRITPAGQTCPF